VQSGTVAVVLVERIDTVAFVENSLQVREWLLLADGLVQRWLCLSLYRWSVWWERVCVCVWGLDCVCVCVCVCVCGGCTDERKVAPRKRVKERVFTKPRRGNNHIRAAESPQSKQTCT
jgi:hypothetical protein